MHQVFEWKNIYQQKIFAQAWLPETHPDIVICFIHGQSEHSGRYVHVANFFNKNNVAFVAADLIGHGK